MLIETWVAVLIIIFIFILGMGSLIGWILADQRLENTTEENKTLLKENTQLKSKISFLRLYYESERENNDTKKQNTKAD